MWQLWPMYLRSFAVALALSPAPSIARLQTLPPTGSRAADKVVADALSTAGTDRDRPWGKVSFVKPQKLSISTFAEPDGRQRYEQFLVSPAN